MYESSGVSPQKNDKLQKKRSISSLWKSSNGQAQEFEPPAATGGTRHARRKSPPQIDEAFATRGSGIGDRDRKQSQVDSDDDGENTAPDRDTLEVFSQLASYFKTTGADQDDRDPSSQPSQSQGDSEGNTDLMLSPNRTKSPIPGESENWWQSITGGMLDGAGNETSADSGPDAAAGSSLLDDDQSPDDMLSLFVEWIKTTRGESEAPHDTEQASPSQDTQKEEESEHLADLVPPKDPKPKTRPPISPTTSESSLKSDNSFLPSAQVDPLNKESVVPTGVGWARYQAWQESNTDEAKNFRKWLSKRQAERRPSRGRMKGRAPLHRKYSNSSLDSGSFQSSMDRDDNSSVTGDSYGSSYDSVKRERHNTADSGGGSGTPSDSQGGSGSREESNGESSHAPHTRGEGEAGEEQKESEEPTPFDFFHIDTSAIESLFTASTTTEEEGDKEVDLLDQLGEWVRDTMNITSPMIGDGRSRSSSGNSSMSDTRHSTSANPNMEVWNPIHRRGSDEDEAVSPPLTAHSPLPEQTPPGRRKNSDKGFIDLDWGNKVEEWVSEQSSEFETKRLSVQAEAEEMSNQLKKSLFGFMGSSDEDKGTIVEAVQVVSHSPEVDARRGTSSIRASVGSNDGSPFEDDDFHVPSAKPQAAAFNDFDTENDFSDSAPATPATRASPVQLTPLSQASQGSANRVYSDQPKPDRSGVRNLLL